MSLNKHGGVGVMPADGGDIRVCAAGDAGAGYDTLCGTSLSDDEFVRVEINARARINCPMCKSVWSLSKTFKADNFT